MLQRFGEPFADLGLYLYCRANYALKVEHDPQTAARLAGEEYADLLVWRGAWPERRGL